jgi:hypothetical protein
MSWTNKTKNPTTFTDRPKQSVTAKLWDASNNPWDEDYLPWQDEEVVVNTNYSNKAKNSTSFANKAKS